MVTAPFMRPYLLFLLLLGLVLPSCGPGGGEAPVPIDEEHLEGYWLAESEDNPVPSPILLHFGVKTFGDEAPEGSPTVETMGLEVSTMIVGPYTLSDGHIQFQQKTDDGYGTFMGGKVESLTASTMALTFSLFPGKITFRRVDGCGGAGLWFGPTFYEVKEAAYDSAGVLHMLTTDHLLGTADYYVYVPPGRCTVYTADKSLTGQAIDVGSDDSIRIVTLQPPTATQPAEMALSVIPPRPWTRKTLDPVTWNEKVPELPSGSTVMRTFEPTPGEAVVLWAYGDELHSLTKQGSTIEHDQTVLHHGTSLTPNYLTVLPEPGGTFLVRGTTSSGGARYDHGTWTEWKADDTPDSEKGKPILATLIGYGKDGTFHAAWEYHLGSSEVPYIRVGRRHEDGTWDTVDAGVGAPYAIHVRDDGGVDVAAMRADTQTPILWAHVPPSFEPGAWTEWYTLDPRGTIDFSTLASAYLKWPVARFGPSDEVFLGGFHGAWRNPALEKPGEVFRWQPIAITFDAETPAKITFPATGDSCTESCTLLMPPSAILSARLSTTDPAAQASLVSGSFAPLDDGGWAVYSDISLLGPGKLPVEITLHAQKQHAVVKQVEGSATLLGASLNGAGDLAVATSDNGNVPSILVQKAGKGAPSTLTFTGGFQYPITQAHDGVHALAAGGWVMPVLGAPTVTNGKAGVVFLDAGLNVTQVQPVDAGDKAIALADDGFRELRVGNTGAVVLTAHTAPGPGAPVTTDLIGVEDAATMDDGVVIYTSHDYGTFSHPGSGDAGNVWTKVTASGATAWTLKGDPKAELAWSVDGGDLLIHARYVQPWTLGGTTFARAPGAAGTVPSEAVIRVDGKSGAISSSLGALTSDLGAASTLALAPDGVAVLTANTVGVLFQHMPWSGKGLQENDYVLDDPTGVTCITMTCGAGRAYLQRNGAGYSGAWGASYGFDYDGTVLDPAGGAVLYGTWTP